MDPDAIASEVARHGLIARGAFHPAPADGVPGTPRTLVLVGNAGPAMWRAFAAGRRVEPDPLDAWTRRVLGEAAANLGAIALFPFDGPPYLPFQRWAGRCEPVSPSPIGPLIHPAYGLWHAYRGALAFEGRLDMAPPAADPSPCESCADKPCLAACPVDALKPGAYDVKACVGHIEGTAGKDCMDLGCRARRACPIGRAYTYQPDQARFHMAHFARANRD